MALLNRSIRLERTCSRQPGLVSLRDVLWIVDPGDPANGGAVDVLVKNPAGYPIANERIPQTLIWASGEGITLTFDACPVPSAGGGHKARREVSRSSVEFARLEEYLATLKTPQLDDLKTFAESLHPMSVATSTLINAIEAEYAYRDLALQREWIDCGEKKSGEFGSS